MSFKIGIIGLPNVGKSTLFNALTKSSVKVENFPFCTIKPHIGMVEIPDIRAQKLQNVLKSQKIIPNFIEFYDIAGLVKGASKGEGLGNQFLNNIRKTDAIVHVVRCFHDESIIHVENRVDPIEDIEIIDTELILSDLTICENAIYKIKKFYRNNTKNAEFNLYVLEKCLLHLNNSLVLRTLILDEKEKIFVYNFGFLTFKPTLYIANINRQPYEKNFSLNKILELTAFKNSLIMELSISLEAQISKINKQKIHKFINEDNFNKSKLNVLIKKSYQLLKLQTFFTASVKEIHAWTIPIGTSAKKAASIIHTDFEKGFIRAQVISFEDFIIYKGYESSKAFGKIRIEGKNYIINDGDILHFLFKI